MTQVPFAENIIFSHQEQIINQEMPANVDPLNAMDEDLLDEFNGNIYEDSQDILVDKEEIADTFLNFDNIQDLDMSSESSKRRRVEEGDEGLSRATN